MIAETASCCRFTSNQLATSVGRELVSLQSSSNPWGHRPPAGPDVETFSGHILGLGLSHVPTLGSGSGLAPLEPRGLRMGDWWLPKEVFYQKLWQAETAGDNHRCHLARKPRFLFKFCHLPAV